MGGRRAGIIVRRCTPLTAAANHNYLVLAGVLIAAGADIEKESQFKYGTPLPLLRTVATLGWSGC